MLRGIVLFVILFVGTVPIFLLLLLFGLPPLLFPESVRVTLRGPQLLCGRAWITMCLAGFRLFGVSAPEVEGEVRLNAQGRYLLLSNHASWTDIVVLLQLFGPRMPFPRFLAKREMLWFRLSVLPYGCLTSRCCVEALASALRNVQPVTAQR